MKNYLSLDDNILNNDINNYNNIYKNESIYILNYIYGKDIKTSYGKLNYIKENKIIHKCNTDSGSSGSPIMLLKNNKIIGVHYAGSKNNKVIGVHYGYPKHNKNFNFGTLLKKPLLEYIKENIKLNKEIKSINKGNIKLNLITAEINIKEEDINKDIRILISFEEYKRNDGYVGFIEKKDYYLYENEKEIKDNCKIRINNNDIEFNYFYKFKETGILL